MKRTITDDGLERMLRAYNESGFEGSGRIREQLLRQSAPGENTGLRRRPGLRVLMVATALLLVTTTVFAQDAANLLRRLTTPQMEAIQLSELYSEFDGEKLSSSIKMTRPGSPTATDWSRIDPKDLLKAQTVSVASPEQAGEALPFKVRELCSLPEGYAFQEALLMQLPSGVYAEAVTLRYAGEGGSILSFAQTRVGDDAFLDIQTVEGLEQAQVWGHEAFALSHEQGKMTHLIWLADGVMYQLTVGADVQTAVAIAESAE